jgi:hypothetical protein
MKGLRSLVALVGASMVIAVGAATAAEVEVERAYLRDGLGTALVIVRNDDEPRGYASVALECVFTRGDRVVGQAGVEIKDLKYRQRVAARLTAVIDGDQLDRADCRIADAKLG